MNLMLSADFHMIINVDKYLVKICIVYEFLSESFFLLKHGLEEIDFLFRRNVRASRDAQHRKESLFIIVIRPVTVELVVNLRGFLFKIQLVFI